MLDRWFTGVRTSSVYVRTFLIRQWKLDRVKPNGTKILYYRYHSAVMFEVCSL